MLERALRVCREVLGPMVRADGGELYLVKASNDELVLHLGRNCTGCPGFSTTTRDVLEPALQSVAPGLRVTVTNGFVVPPGAEALSS